MKRTLNLVLTTVAVSIVALACTAIPAVVADEGGTATQDQNQWHHGWEDGTEPLVWEGVTQSSTYAEAVSDGVAAATGGGFVITFPEHSYGPNEYLDLLDQGQKDFGSLGLMYLYDRFGHAAEIFPSQVGVLCPLQYSLWYMCAGQQYLEEMLGGTSIHVVDGARFIQPEEVFLHSNVPLETTEDFGDLEIRTKGFGGVILSKWGAHCSPLPLQETLDGLSTGDLDAAEYGTLALNWDSGLADVAEFVYISGCRAPAAVTSFAANAGSWNSLPDQYKTVLESVATQKSIELYQQTVEECLLAYEQFQTTCTVEPLSPAIEQAYFSELYEYMASWADDDPFVAELLESLESFREGYRDALPRPQP